MTVTHTLPSNYDSNGGLNATLIAGGGQTTGTSVTEAKYTTSQWTSYANPMIWYDSTDQKWYDAPEPGGPEPIYIAGTNTFSVPSTGWDTTSTSANPQYVYVGNNTTGANFQMGFESPYYTASSGGGINTLSGNPNPTIVNVNFSKNGADNELTLTFDWDENMGDFSSFHIYKEKIDGTGVVSVSHGVTGSSGSVSLNSSDYAILGNVSDGDKFWIRNNPTYTNTEPDFPLDIVVGFGGIARPYTHVFIDWSVGYPNGVKSVIAKYYGVNTGFTHDHVMFAYGKTINEQGVEHSYTGSLITQTMPYKAGSNRYYIQKAVSDDGSGVTGWEDYGSDFRTPIAKVFSNFW